MGPPRGPVVLHRGRAPRSSAQVAAQWRFVPTVPFELQPHATALISPATAQLSPLHSPPPSPTARATAPRTALPSTTACGSARTTSVQAFANPTELKVGGAMSSSLTPQADDPFGGRSIRTRARFESRSIRPCVHRSPRSPALTCRAECCLQVLSSHARAPWGSRSGRPAIIPTIILDDPAAGAAAPAPHATRTPAFRLSLLLTPHAPHLARNHFCIPALRELLT